VAVGDPRPRLDSRPLDRTSLSNLNRRVRTRMLGGVGAGEGDLPGYPIGLLTNCPCRWRYILRVLRLDHEARFI